MSLVPSSQRVTPSESQQVWVFFRGSSPGICQSCSVELACSPNTLHPRWFPSEAHLTIQPSPERIQSLRVLARAYTSSPCSLSTLVQPPCTGLALSTSTVVGGRSNISTSTTLSTPVSRSLGRSVHLSSRIHPDRHHPSGSKFAHCNCGHFPNQLWILYAPVFKGYREPVLNLH